MPRRVYIFCDYDERNIAPVEAVCSYLYQAKCVIEFAPQFAWGHYRLVEEAIERCDVFIAVIGRGHSSSTWLQHELLYAHRLTRMRFSPRPRLFAIHIKGYDFSPYAKEIPLEVLETEDTYQSLLEDLPE
jgi:hypothetical protein